VNEAIRDEIRAASAAIGSLQAGADDIAAIASLVVETLRGGGTVFLAGCGGSAADAQHWAAELSGRYLKDRRPLSAVALSTNSSVLTAIGNDLGFDEVFSRQVQAHAGPGDAVLLISTSGRSPSILAAFEAARAQGSRVAVITGRRGSELAARADASLVVDSEHTPRIQEAHAVAGHIICGFVEDAIADG
jgi:D-sedoheptulose 7-phosphate isomerase